MTSYNDELLQLLHDFRQKASRAVLVRAANALEAMPLPDDPAPYLSKYQYGGATRQAAVAAVRALLEELDQ